MNSIGASILAFLAVVVLFGQRRWALMGMMAGVLYLTQFQAINVLGFNLFAVRFLELFGFIRVMVRKEFSFSWLNKTDWALLLFFGFTTIVFCLRSSDGQANMIGTAVDAFLCYFAFRGLIGGMEDFRWFLRSFLLLLAPYALMVLFESWTHHDVFSFIGAGIGSWMRGDRFRCVGSFRNPDLLGSLGACFLPLYIGMACIKAQRKLACIGIVLCLLIVWASNSGGPLCATAVGLIGWGFWRLRMQMRKVRWAMAAAIAALVMVMKAPIWYLLARVSDITGGDGWHRAYLLDVSFQHLGLWWLAGMNILETADWFPDGALTSTGAADITNQFLSFGLTAGLGAMALLILLLARAFSDLGKALAVVRSHSQETSDNEFLLWGLGVMLTVHIANWFGITYFDQFYVIWFMQLAAISSISSSYMALQSQASDAVDLPEEVETLQPAAQFRRELAQE
jgi:hypothetical protein